MVLLGAGFGHIFLSAQSNPGLLPGNAMVSVALFLFIFGVYTRFLLVEVDFNP
jgi:hypothetical protein